MNGYLQRLVSTAVGRGESVYPRTGSMFSPRPTDANPAMDGWERSETVLAGQPHLQPRDTSKEHGATPPLEGVRGKAVPDRLLPNAVESAVGLDKTVAPVNSEPRPSSTSVAPQDERAGEELRFHAPSAKHVEVPPPVAPTANQPFRPLLGPNNVSETNPRFVAPRQVSHERPIARGEREPDEIQIHIGRIEVTAVPAPVTRPPKSPDKTPSLEAYLKRGEGRAR